MQREPLKVSDFMLPLEQQKSQDHQKRMIKEDKSHSLDYRSNENLPRFDKLIIERQRNYSLL